MNVVFSLSLPRVNSEFSIRFPISENVSIMRNFPVVHHFGKLTVNEGFCAVKILASCCFFLCKIVFSDNLLEICGQVTDHALN